MSGHDELSRRERQIMQAVFEKGSVTIKEVGESIPNPPSATALRTLLGILVKKGWLKSKSSGREKVYSPRKSKTVTSRVELKNVLRTFFSGSIENLLASHFADPDSKLDEAAIERIKALIAEHEVSNRENQ
jgi:predicted transcriptional regulator